MNRSINVAAAVVLAASFATHADALGTAGTVVSYDAGTTPAFGGYESPAAALGAPESMTGEGVWPSAVSPFSPPWGTTEIVSVGEGGHLTLMLTNQVLPDPTGPELGVFTNVGLLDTAWPSGSAGDPVSALGIDSAVLEVSADGANWVSLGETLFDIPANGYTDLTDPYAATAGAVESAFDQPFTGMLDDFAGLSYYDAGATDVLDVLAGSGGGTWIDISATGLAQVSYVRFSVADDGNAQVDLNFELDAVTISAAALGAAIPEPSSLLLVATALLLAGRGRSRR